jgi:hypothetical protein
VELEKENRIFYFPGMEKILSKFANSQWLMKIIFLIMGALALHMRYLSSYMGR